MEKVLLLDLASRTRQESLEPALVMHLTQTIRTWSMKGKHNGLN